MSDMYIPPFTMTEEIVNMVIDIGKLVGRIDAHDDLSLNPTLRRENRIKSDLFFTCYRTEYFEHRSGY